MSPNELRTWRELRGWSQGQLARALEVGLRSVNGWENGRPIPNWLPKVLSLIEKENPNG